MAMMTSMTDPTSSVYRILGVSYQTSKVRRTYRRGRNEIQTFKSKAWSSLSVLIELLHHR